MRENHVRKLWQEGRPVVNGWLAIGNSYSAELLASLDYDALTVDLQHGMIDFQCAITLFQAIAAQNRTPLARVPGNEPALIMKLLDAGAYGLICPLINSAEECRRFVEACRYPPRGERSFGPARGLLYGGPDYFRHADDTVLTLAMIETRAALNHLDEILDVAELDGIFIGPHDLGISLGYGPGAEHEPEVAGVIEAIRAKAKAKGRMTGIFSSDSEKARRRVAQGFDLVTPGSDSMLLKAAAEAALITVRQP